MRSRAAGPAEQPRDREQDWSPATNLAVRELLDHLADELAREYIRLMKKAAEDTATESEEGGNEE